MSAYVTMSLSLYVEMLKLFEDVEKGDAVESLRSRCDAMLEEAMTDGGTLYDAAVELRAAQQDGSEGAVRRTVRATEELARVLDILKEAAK